LGYGSIGDDAAQLVQGTACNESRAPEPCFHHDQPNQLWPYPSAVNAHSAGWLMPLTRVKSCVLLPFSRQVVKTLILCNPQCHCHRIQGL